MQWLAQGIFMFAPILMMVGWNITLLSCWIYRSEVKLRKLGDELCLDNEKIGANEEDSSINIVSDGEAIGFPMSPHNERQTDVFQSNKIQNVGRGCPRESAQGSKLFNVQPQIYFEFQLWS